MHITELKKTFLYQLKLAIVPFHKVDAY